MGNVGFQVQGGAKIAKLAVTGKAKSSRMIRVVGHVWRKSEEDAYRTLQIWVEVKRSATIGWVLSRVMEEVESTEPDFPNIVGLRILRRDRIAREQSDQDGPDDFLESVEDDLLIDYGQEVDAVLGRGDSLECLFEVPSDTPCASVCSVAPASACQVYVERVGLGHFSIVRGLGAGATSRVLQVRHRNTNQIYAMKVISKRNSMKDEKTVQRIVTEKRILAKLSHPFIVSLHWAFQTDAHLFMVLDFCEGGELFYHYQRLGAFPEVDCRFYVSEILLGLEYLHALSVLYRDLKLENCLLDKHGHTRLTDFGLSREDVNSKSGLCQSIVGTVPYLSPEMLTKEGHGLPLDYYCLGCLLHLLLTERVPYEGADLQQMFSKRVSGARLHVSSRFSIEVGDLLRQLLEADPARRLFQAEAIKMHPWFAEVDFAKVYDRVSQPVFPKFPPISPAQQTKENFDPVFNLDLNESFYQDEHDSGTIAGFSKIDSPTSPCKRKSFKI